MHTNLRASRLCLSMFHLQAEHQYMPGPYIVSMHGWTNGFVV